MGGRPVYPNVDVRAAHLLYFVIKNHPFFDGNKRIGSLLFLHYLDKNHRPLFEESALVAWPYSLPRVIRRTRRSSFG